VRPSLAQARAPRSRVGEGRVEDLKRERHVCPEAAGRALHELRALAVAIVDQVDGF
jgi:hypothetical protein